LGDLREFVGRLLQLAPQPIAEDSSISVDTSSPITASPLHSRQQALKQLSSIANYFRVNEPSSPVILLLDRAVTWGEMSLSDLLKELIEDQSSLAMAGKILGIQPQQEAN
jgi:type VI secretion system protein ImpA